MNLLKILDGTTEPPIIDLHLDRLNDSGDYSLPTPMYDFQKELTDQIVSLHYSDILKFCETDDFNDLIMKSLQICIDNCQLVATHPYLLINHYMPKNFFMKDLPLKLVETSGKFNVLRDLVNVILSSVSSRPKNIGVVLQNNLKVIDLTEALLVGCGSNSTRIIRRYNCGSNSKELKKASKNGVGDANASPSPVSTKDDHKSIIHLIPHDGEVNINANLLNNSKFDLLLVFDSYVDTNTEFVKNLRCQNRRGDAVIIRLVPMRTIEHAQLFYQDQIHSPTKSYLYKLISSIVCLRDHIGTLPPDMIPIYNQKLTFLLPFFNEYFKSTVRSNFPEWPLPDLPKIPRFSEIDVERSLLTEVHYHYTPYDSTDSSQKHLNDEDKKPTKKTYYEMKRLQLDYVTNPLKNDYDKLIGIQSNVDSYTVTKLKQNLLTHKLILQLNNAFNESALVQREFDTYKQFEQAQTTKFGRRKEEFEKALTNLNDDIDHAESRINIANKKTNNKSEEIEKIKEEIKKNQDHIDNFLDKEANKDIGPEFKKLYEVHQDIWNLQRKIKEYLAKIKSKDEEKNYMTNEYENSLKSIQESKEQIKALNESLVNNKRKYDSIVEVQEEERVKLDRQKQDQIKEIEEQKEKNEALRLKLAKTLKFLKDTSHLKKRKGRLLTPGK
jgi:hypothetical protein